jgi:outer membrane immunogenic protein
MESFETVRGRLGIAFDRLLVYGTGGWMAARLSESANWLFPTPTATYPASNSRTGSGGVWGGGVEYAYTNNLTFKVEALGYRLGTDTFAANGTGAGVGTGALYQLTTKGWLVRGGVNWKFDWWGYHG